MGRKPRGKQGPSLGMLNRFTCVLAAAALVAFLLPGRAGAQGLALDTAKEKTLEQYDEPNPHFELDCTECHGAMEEQEQPVSRPAVRVSMTGCMDCHDEKGASNDCLLCHK